METVKVKKIKVSIINIERKLNAKSMKARNPLYFMNSGINNFF